MEPTSWLQLHGFPVNWGAARPFNRRRAPFPGAPEVSGSQSATRSFGSLLQSRPNSSHMIPTSGYPLIPLSRFNVYSNLQIDTKVNILENKSTVRIFWGYSCIGCPTSVWHKIATRWLKIHPFQPFTNVYIPPKITIRFAQGTPPKNTYSLQINPCRG